MLAGCQWSEYTVEGNSQLAELGQRECSRADHLAFSLRLAFSQVCYNQLSHSTVCSCHWQPTYTHTSLLHHTVTSCPCKVTYMYTLRLTVGSQCVRCLSVRWGLFLSWLPLHVLSLMLGTQCVKSVQGGVCFFAATTCIVIDVRNAVCQICVRWCLFLRCQYMHYGWW